MKKRTVWKNFAPSFEYGVCMVGGAINVKNGKEYIGYQNELTLLTKKGWKLKNGYRISKDFIWQRQVG